MSTKENLLDESAKARIMHSEVEKQGFIRKDSFARDAQSKVDRRSAGSIPQNGAAKIKKR